MMFNTTNYEKVFDVISLILSLKISTGYYYIHK